MHQKEELAKRLEQCKQAADATAGTVMKYEGRYILPLFHERSADGHAPGRQIIRICSRWKVSGMSWEAMKTENHRNCSRETSRKPKREPWQ